MSAYVALICNLEQIWPYCDPEGTVKRLGAGGNQLVRQYWLRTCHRPQRQRRPDYYKDIVGGPATSGDFTAIGAVDLAGNHSHPGAAEPERKRGFASRQSARRGPCNPKLLYDRLDARLHAEFWNGRR